jgi:nicotinamidase-related amidase
MPLTTLDPKTALVVIDLQKGLAAYPTVPHSVTDVVAKSRQLAEGFRERGLPVVLVNVTGGAPGRIEQTRPAGGRPSDWAELIPELGAMESDIRVPSAPGGRSRTPTSRRS